MKRISRVIDFPWRVSGLFCCFLVFAMVPSCRSDSYWVKLSGPQTISDQWIDLGPRQPLRVDKDRQYIVLDLELPFRDSPGLKKDLGILMPDGDVINPDVELMDQDNKTYQLVYAGSTGAFPNPDTKYALPKGADFPRDRVYKTVRIRSPRPIKVKAIYWFCDSVRDWP